MGTTSQTLGAIGEELAFHFLGSRGYKVLVKNYECPLGEIDLIAKESGCLVFLEVKTRSSLLLGSPAEAVTRQKRHQIVKAAQFYMKRYGIRDATCRFDVVSVLLEQGMDPNIEIIQNAFGESD